MKICDIIEGIKKYRLPEQKGKLIKAEKIPKINFLSPRNLSWKISEETERCLLNA